MVIYKIYRPNIFVARTKQVAALLSPDHSSAEGLLLNLVGTTSAEITLPALSLALNALALLIIERADTKLLSEVLGRLRTQRGSSRLLHLFCTSLNQLTRLGQSDTLLALLKTALQLVYFFFDCLNRIISFIYFFLEAF